MGLVAGAREMGRCFTHDLLGLDNPHDPYGSQTKERSVLGGLKATVSVVAVPALAVSLAGMGLAAIMGSPLLAGFALAAVVVTAAWGAAYGAETLGKAVEWFRHERDQPFHPPLLAYSGCGRIFKAFAYGSPH